MSGLIDDLLEVARIDAGRPLGVEPEAVALRDPVEEAVEAVRPPGVPGPEVAVEGDLDATVHADPRRVVQLLTNLLANAVRYADAGVSVRVRAGNGLVTVEVEDDGPGVPEEEIPHLFDRFWQARRAQRGGAGLGLAIARAIVEAHGGDIEVESEPGRGALFRFSLPAPP